MPGRDRSIAPHRDHCAPRTVLAPRPSVSGPSQGSPRVVSNHFEPLRPPAPRWASAGFPGPSATVVIAHNETACHTLADPLVSKRDLCGRRVVHRRILISSMAFMPNKSTADYLFEKAERYFRRSRTNSNLRVELEALGNAFMVKAVELDIKLQKLANDTSTASSPARA
jgi:hypothetical protein